MKIYAPKAHLIIQSIQMPDMLIIYNINKPLFFTCPALRHRFVDYFPSHFLQLLFAFPNTDKPLPFTSQSCIALLNKQLMYRWPVKKIIKAGFKFVLLKKQFSEELN